VIGSIASWARAPQVGNLRRQVESLQQDKEYLNELLEAAEGGYYELLSNQLSVLSNDTLGFGDTERISVYKHDGSAFVMIGRYSKHPEYVKKGRAIYPDNEGAMVMLGNTEVPWSRACLIPILTSIATVKS
jgi:hypothetical protein